MTETKKPADELAIGNTKTTDGSADSTTLPAASQRQIILASLQLVGSVSTLCCHELGVMSPAPRILELRRQGYKIETHWQTAIDRAGIVHRQGLYVLIPSPNVGGAE